MKISSFSDLKKLESQIAAILKKYKLGDVLGSLYLLKKSSPTLEPFMIAGVALLAARFCVPSKSTQLRNNYDIRSLVALSNTYYLADPIVFDQDLHNEFINSNPVFLMLRLVSSQFPFAPGFFSEFSRPALLFHEIPNQLKGLPNIPQFDFEAEFQALTGVSVLDLITTGFVISAASRENFTFSQAYLNKARKQGICIPDDSTLRKILKQLAADKFELIELYENRKNKDRRFQMYDFNPLLSYPIIKPCQDRGFNTLGKDFLHVPIPELVGSRVSTGIFYQMYNAHATSSGNKFAEYFGHVFEAYVGLILRNSITSEQLISELDIRKFYPTKKGKAPDWILTDGSKLILFECKATRFSRAAQSIASEEAVNSSLAQVIKGLKQIDSFISACRANTLGLQGFQSCITFSAILVSLEPMYLINSTFFRSHIDTLLADEGIINLEWQIISIDELEAFQPHIASGIRLSKVLNDLKQKTFNDVLEDLVSQTNKSFTDSFLYPKQKELYQRLGIIQEMQAQARANGLTQEILDEIFSTEDD